MQSQEKKNCSISSDTKTWTNTYNIIETQRIGEKLVFIDISGLNDATDEENNIRKVTDAIAEHPNFRAFSDIDKFYWFKLDSSVVTTLTQYMILFPIKDFWKNTIIIRTYVKKDDPDFEDDKKI